MLESPPPNPFPRSGNRAQRTEHIVFAVNCGLAVNPDQDRAQIEGGSASCPGAIMAEEITLTAGKVDQGNFDGYTALRIDAVPAAEVHILPSANTPSGIGEPGASPIGPAGANAVYKALGKRIRVILSPDRSMPDVTS
ncbi:molybdopterin-dependent oxidoreductase [Ensifer psoraleae]|uniref:Molybdopterin-dependent oxidoreductase n=1 Tax=Sinorhizobium psoraleae TaxID=520838 RepID=A0ABT4KMW5_9HYPH|nr:molybdopterin cofactor-binding domain-containing protein [Sinorhizobium psoraleae]MCZ4093296.1 molybdopterin-dependent oxidoreductase [Sinorhizobium psoraleae]